MSNPVCFFFFHYSSRLQPDQNRVKKQAALDSSLVNLTDDVSKKSNKQINPGLDLAPPTSEDDELTPEEVQMVCTTTKLM